MKPRRILLFACLFVMLFSLSACSNSHEKNIRPTEIVEEFLKAAQLFDLDKMSSLLNDNTALASLTVQNEGWFSYFKEMIALMSYKVTKVDIGEDKAYVTVDCTIVDGKAIMQEVITDYYTEAYKWIKEGKEPSAKETNYLLSNIMKKHMAEHTERSMIDRSITIECIKTDRGWLIKEMNGPLGNVLTANFIDAMYEIQTTLEEIMAKIAS